MRNAWRTALVAAVVATGSAGLYHGWSPKASAQVQSDDSKLLLTQISLELTLMRTLLQKQLECQQCIAPQFE